MSEGRNHYLICYSCFKNEYFRKDQYKEWCTLIIRCPDCLKSNWLGLGTNVSQENLEWLVEKHVAPEERSSVVYSDNIIRSFEGVVQCFLKENIQDFKMKTSGLGTLNSRVRDLTGHELGDDFLRVRNAPMQWWWSHPPPGTRERFEKNDIYFAGHLDANASPEGSTSDEREAWWQEHRTAMYDFYNHFEGSFYSKDQAIPF